MGEIKRGGLRKSVARKLMEDPATPKFLAASGQIWYQYFKTEDKITLFPEFTYDDSTMGYPGAITISIEEFTKLNWTPIT